MTEIAGFGRKTDDSEWKPYRITRGKRKDVMVLRNERTGALKDMVPETGTASSAGADNPRTQAAKKMQEQAQDYAFARESAVPNLGEDVLGSARHLRNRWKSLEEAEQNGTAEELVTRDKLLKNEPPDFMAQVNERNQLAMLAAKLALDAFPVEPSASRSPGHSTEQRRRQYYDSYVLLKGVCEQAGCEETDPNVALQRIHDAVEAQVRALRQIPPGASSYAQAGDRYNPIANQLIDMANRTRPQRFAIHYGKKDVGMRVLDFSDRLRKKYGEPSQELLARSLGHVKDILEGDSFNKTFDTVGTGGAKFSASELYVEHAVRKGGPVIDASTIAAGSEFMARIAGMRGLQWGNSVTDEERQHHLQKSAEAFADLTDILGLPTSAASLSGTLALAIGARGRANALAHYEPASKIINLTRKGGVGSLAHEWGHALDHWLAGGKLSGGPSQRRAGDLLSEQRNEKTAIRTESGFQVVDNTKDPTWIAMRRVRDAMQASGFNKRLANELATMRSRRIMTPEMSSYYASDCEKFARCFERHVQRKLHLQGRENTYLAGLRKEGHPLWPSDDEVDALAPAFDALIEATRQRMPNP